MNKNGFIKELSKQTGYDEEKCILINNVIENHFILGRKNKDKIIQDLQAKVNLSKEDSEKIYNMAIKIIATETKNKIKYPFKSKD